MKNHKSETDRAETVAVRPSCNHPHAVIFNPTERELREFEVLLANCPNCSRWSPGDGPIMAVLSTETASSKDNNKGFC